MYLVHLESFAWFLKTNFYSRSGFRPRPDRRWRPDDRLGKILDGSTFNESLISDEIILIDGVIEENHG